MTRNHLPLVVDNHILGLDEAGNPFAAVAVGTDAWYSWLGDQQIQSFSFRSPLGTFTVRRERKRHGWYWYAYRKHTGKLRKAYLGKTEELTLERLNTVAARIGQSNQDNGSQALSREPEGGDLLLSSAACVDQDLFFLDQISAPPSLKDPEPTSSQSLSAQLTPLIGREREVAAACDFLRHPEIRLLTITGTGGVGKTRLALQIAADLLGDFPDGTCFVSLAPISDPNLVIPTVAQTLGLREAHDQPFIELLATHLQRKHLLLFLDNFEQVIGAAPALTTLLGRCSSLKVVVTSREVLRVCGEQEFPVLPLALPTLSLLPEPEAVSHYAAVALFLQRAQAVQPDFQLTADNARTIAAICTRLDGLPLALELAATRLKLLSPQVLLACLEHRLAILTHGPRDVPARQQTLRNTLQWSYDLLDAQEQRLFRRLAVCVGGCTLDAVKTICNAPGNESINEFDGIASLVDKSLVQRQSPQGDDASRFVMLETIREFGLECLSISGERESTRFAHAWYYLRLAEQVVSKLGGPEQAMWLDHIAREHDNLRAAMQWSLELGDAGRQDSAVKREIVLRFGIALHGFWIVRGYSNEGRAFLERALAASGETESALRTKVLGGAASLALFQNDHERAEVLCRESLVQCRTRGDREGISFALYLLGNIAWQRGDFSVARSLMEESLALTRQEGDKEAIASLLTYLAGQVTQQGEFAKAQAFLEESLTIQRALGDTRGIIYSLLALALTLFVSQGDFATVTSLLAESLVLSRELGDKSALARGLSHSALVALQQDDLATAHRLSEESLAFHRETGDRWGICWVLSIIARVEARQDHLVAALEVYEQSLSIARKIGSKLNIAICLEGMASILVKQGEPARAAQLWGAAEAIRESMGAPIWPVERAAYECLLTAARAKMGKRAFVIAWMEGRTLPLEQVLVAQAAGIMPAPTSAASSFTPLAASPAGLTRREIEVLRLLALGLTNAQIASKLVISLSTVNTHVVSIYTKMGVNSRVAATRCAVAYHLV